MSTIREDLLPQPGDVIAEHYQIEKLLGHGGMGAVFAAKHTRTGRAVAIKWMLPAAASSAEALARFIAEAQATARIEHPNVVHIYDF
ncbi:MAG: protein kinase, partial [Myxococcales bacterium]|nr:protein kinase [Myxococcales bacterium]